MNSRVWGALYGVCFAVALGWGLTGVVEGGCGWVHFSQGTRCESSDGYVWSWYPVVSLIAILSLPPLGWTVIRTDDWRPSLGLSVGAAIALGITLSADGTRGLLMLAVAEGASAMGVPLILWRIGRSKARATKMSKTRKPT
ncbi:hypothetical protein [Streptomyces sp. AM6-12]|uniref:hypothetical protein n=1 Tax=Streptomyces sp. AM6-12 TaxID=3345149 RepID=UPI00378A7A77